MAKTRRRLIRWSSIVLIVPYLITCTASAQPPKDAPSSDPTTALPRPPVIATTGATRTPTATAAIAEIAVDPATPNPTLDQAADSTSVCRAGDPLANVWGPSRLNVVSPCLTVTGVVVSLEIPVDGDWEIALLVDQPYLGLLNRHNLEELSGTLRVEVVPADQPDCTVGKPPKGPKGNNYPGICTGANVAKPNLGAHIRVVGPYVKDTDGGWMEIHPVWSAVPLAAAPKVGTAVAPIATRLARLTDSDEEKYLDTPGPTP